MRRKYEASPWDLVVAEAPPGPWVKAAAVMPAARGSTADLIVVADADVWHPGLEWAIAAVQDGASWAIPHRGVYRLTEAGTAGLLRGEELETLTLTQPAYLGMEGGGYVIARRETLLQVPLDRRFVGWGQEDDSWARALRTLAGEPWRGKGPLTHLYHPPQERLTRRWGSMEGKALRKRYVRATGNPDAMRSLLDELDDTDQPAVRDLHTV